MRRQDRSMAQENQSRGTTPFFADAAKQLPDKARANQFSCLLCRFLRLPDLLILRTSERLHPRHH